VPSLASDIVASVVVLNGTAGKLWDVEHVEAYRANGPAIRKGIQNLARWSAHGFSWVTDPTCLSGTSCATTARYTPLELGGGYPLTFSPMLSVTFISVAKFGLPGYRFAHFVPADDGNSVLIAWQEVPGLILYAISRIAA
jgi:hypothetical protein